MTYVLPRVLPETKGPARALFSRSSALPVGQSVLKISGTYQTILDPTEDQIASATEVYRGGHVYEVSDTVATALTNAGYTVG